MSTPSVLLVDDGELDDVRTLLAQLGTEFVHLRGGQIPDSLEPPSKLFIATTRRALLAEPWPVGPTAPRKIAIVTEDSNTLRNRLRRAGYDLLVRRPVHPYALRLVLLKGLFSGSEKRVDRRVPIGHPIRYRTGLRQRKAWIADLSLSGGRMLLNEKLVAGSRITMQLPSGVTDGKALTLRGSVLRVNPAGQNSGGAKFAAAIHFEKLSIEAKRRIFTILNDRLHGPAVLPDAVPMDRIDPPEEVQTSPEEDDQRAHARVAYEKEVVAPGEAASVLLGRDLSMGGMRIHAHDSLKLGDRIDLALYGNPREEPIMVTSEVVRDEAAEGLGLRFLDVPPRVAEKLEKLIGRLPTVEPLQEGESDAMGSIVSRILEHTHEDADGDKDEAAV